MIMVDVLLAIVRENVFLKFSHSERGGGIFKISFFIECDSAWLWNNGNVCDSMISARIFNSELRTARFRVFINSVKNFMFDQIELST